MSIFTKMYRNMITIEKFPVTVIKNNSFEYCDAKWNLSRVFKQSIVVYISFSNHKMYGYIEIIFIL